jgi:hypothetical protein
MGAIEYFAVLFLGTFLGLILGLILKGARLWSKAMAPLFFDRRLHLLILHHPPRGPTAPLTQVFRL